ncbi:MAG: hypothetical protein WBB32_07670 [Flavobacteriales bacterium]
MPPPTSQQQQLLHEREERTRKPGPVAPLIDSWEATAGRPMGKLRLGVDEGVLTGAVDIHAGAVCFEAHMPAGVARQVYWPDGEGGFHWAVESKNRKGWKRFTEHHYTAAK